MNDSSRLTSVNQPFLNLLCGDCLKVMPTLPSKSVDCIIADLPYNIKIADWDAVKDYDAWVLACFKEFERLLKPSGSLWFFHMSFPVICKLNTSIESDTSFFFRQFITINKGLESIAGRCSKSLHTLPRATEYLMFYTMGKLSEGIKKPLLAAYIFGEIEKAKTPDNTNLLARRTISRIFKDVEGYDCVSNWTLGYNNPTKEQYDKLKKYVQSVTTIPVFEREYSDLMFTFNLPLGLTDVWSYSFYGPKASYHPTAKPSKLIKQIIEISTNKGDTVLDPTVGSGSTLQECKNLERNCIAIEREVGYATKIQESILNQKTLLEVCVK